MLDDLLQLIKDAGSLQGRLALVVGGDAKRRSDVLANASVQLGVGVLPLGIDLARRLSVVAKRQRPHQAAGLLRDAVYAAFSGSAIAMLDRTEILFDRGLQLDALDALKRLARAKTVVASWPGELRNGRLLYAPTGHPEHCDHAATGFLVHQIF